MLNIHDVLQNGANNDIAFLNIQNLMILRDDC